MTATTLPNAGMKYKWTLGEDGWNTGMDSNLLALDTLVQCSVISAAATTPPGSPTLGDSYIPATGATGAWVSLVGDIVIYDGSTWVSVAPKEGWVVYDNNTNNYLKYTGTAWVADPLGDRAYADGLASPLTAKVSEVESRADDGDGAVRALIKFQAGGVSSDAVLTNPTINQIRVGASSAAIMGGGSSTDPHLIGLGFPRASLETIGSTLVFAHEVADTSKLRVRKHSTTNVQTALALTTDYTVVVGSGITTVTLNTPLIANERCYAEDTGVVEDKGGTTPSYCGIGPGGYDCQIYSNVMHQVRGAHHRVLGGDHSSIFGGSYGTVWDGTYSVIVGGTQSEVGPGASNGAGVIGGIRSRARGQGAGAVFSAESDVSGAYAIALGGYRLKITGTASAGVGRENTCNGSDSFFWGRGNTSTGNYSMVGGYLNTVGSSHAHSRVDGGYRLTTTWGGETIHWGYRDTENSNTPYVAHKTVYLRKYTAGTAAEKITTIDGTVDTFTPPSGYIWACELYVTARTGALRGGAWKIEYVVQNVSGTVTILGSPTVVALGQDAQLGTAGNASTITVGVVSNAVEINVQPRLDTAVSAKWGGYLEIREVS